MEVIGRRGVRWRCRLVANVASRDAVSRCSISLGDRVPFYSLLTNHSCTTSSAPHPHRHTLPLTSLQQCSRRRVGARIKAWSIVDWVAAAVRITAVQRGFSPLHVVFDGIHDQRTAVRPHVHKRSIRTSRPHIPHRTPKRRRQLRPAGQQISIARVK